MFRLKIITWLWSQPNARFVYTASHVNAWYRAIRLHGCTIPVAVVTDQADGIDPEIEIIQPPSDFLAVKCADWDEKAGLPQCYRRLAIYAPDAAQWLGCDKILQMDIDCIVTGDLTGLFDAHPDLALFRGTSSKRPYNGGMQIVRLGARPEVYTDFSEANAKIASSRFVGSDQAWLAYKLGWGEAKITGEHGVYHYSGQFLRSNGGRYFRPPENMRVLFCPGPNKFMADGSFWNAPMDMQRIVRKCLQTGVTMQRLLALRDKKDWARLAEKHAGAQIIESIDQATPNDVVFVRMRCNGPEKAASLEAVKSLNAKGCTTLPTLQEALWYDDKVAQYEALKQWMPQTWIFTSRADAVAGIEQMTFPVIRKLTQGASSSNVSLVRNKAALKKAITDAFRRGGDGYIYLQEYIKTDCDYRINISGRYLYGKTRYIRSEDEPFASGSGLNSVMYFTDPLERKAALLAVEIAKAVSTQWMCFDFVWTGTEMKVLEMSSAWRADWYEDCPLYYHDLQAAGKMGSEYFGELKTILGVDNSAAPSDAIEVRYNPSGYDHYSDVLQFQLEYVYSQPVILVKDDTAQLTPAALVLKRLEDGVTSVFSRDYLSLRLGTPSDVAVILFDTPDSLPWERRLRNLYPRLAKRYRDALESTRCR